MAGTAPAGQESSNNAAVQTPQVYEQNERSVNAIFLGAVTQGTTELVEQDITTLEAIAVQCPLEGGNAVFKARSLLALYGENTLYDDDDLCQPVGQREGTFKLFPNPATESVTLEWVERFGPQTTLEAYVFDGTGRQVRSLELPAGQNTFSFETANLRAGVYWFEIRENGKPLFSEKLVLVK